MADALVTRVGRGKQLAYKDIDNRLYQRVRTSFDDTASVDAFGRLRISEPRTLFDSKQIFDNQPLFWDESLESGAGITSSHNVSEASTVITSTVSTAGVFTRQTFMRFNYQPGKSQQILITGILDRSGGGTGVERRIGMFDDDNGLFFEDDAGTIGVTRRTNVTGTPVDNTVTQANWNIDPMDGKGPSKVAIDWTKTQIFGIDFEWLGVGRVRMFLVIDGNVYPVHQFLNTNVLTKVYMSTPNLPLRYQMVTTAASPASTMECICSSVISEGGAQRTGVLRYVSTEGTHIDANTADTAYAILGIRLKTANLGAVILIERVSIVNGANGDYEWFLALNPTLANAITFADQTNSSVQTGPGNAGNPSNSTVTGGTLLDGSFVKGSVSSGSIAETVQNAVYLGSTISGTPDEIYLCVRPLAANADIDGSITWRELS